MRSILVLVAVVLSACATNDPGRSNAAQPDSGTVTYYDRNSGGLVDFELHEAMHCDDCDWALVDSDFNGRFDKRVRWSFAIHQDPIDLPVPNGVSLKVGEPPLSGWRD